MLIGQVVIIMISKAVAFIGFVDLTVLLYDDDKELEMKQAIALPPLLLS